MGAPSVVTASVEYAPDNVVTLPSNALSNPLALQSEIMSSFPDIEGISAGLDWFDVDGRDRGLVPHRPTEFAAFATAITGGTAAGAAGAAGATGAGPGAARPAGATGPWRRHVLARVTHRQVDAWVVGDPGGAQNVSLPTETALRAVEIAELAAAVFEEELEGAAGYTVRWAAHGDAEGRERELPENAREWAAFLESAEHLVIARQG